MALTTNAAVLEAAAATGTTVISDAVNASDPQFTVVGDATTFTQTDVASFADMVIDITLATAATAGDSVHLYRQDLDMLGDSGVDANFPSATFKNIYMGSFPLDEVATRQYIKLAAIPLTVKQNFAIEYDLSAVNGTQTNATVVKIVGNTYNAKV